jgi:hypothetical protein
MTDLRTAAQQALEAMEYNRLDVGKFNRINAAIAALRAALAEEALQRLTDVQQEIEAALAEPLPPIGKASTDVGVPVYVVKKAEPPCNPSCAPGYCYCEPVQEPVAWRTFDGEGGYDYRTYEDNEDYAAEWAKRNPRHVGWVEPLYTTSPPQRKPLSAIDLRALYDRHAACQEEGPEISGWWDFARAVEAAHGIKEGT